MDIIENITESLKYPLTDWVKIVILAVVMLVPIVDFIGLGYYLRIIKSTLAGVDELPEFDNIGELFIDGLKLIIVSLIYMLIPIILFLLAWILAAPAATVTYGSDFSYYVPFTAMSGLSIVLMIIGVLLAIIMSIIYLPAIVNMALYDSEIGAAFRFSEILSRVSSIGWGSYILWIIAIWITLGVLGSITFIIAIILVFTLIGIPIAAILLLAVNAYLTIFQARSVGLLFASSVE